MISSDFFPSVISKLYFLRLCYITDFHTPKKLPVQNYIEKFRQLANTGFREFSSQHLGVFKSFAVVIQKKYLQLRHTCTWLQARGYTHAWIRKPLILQQL